MKILVAEDNEDIRYLLERSLRDGYGHEVTTVANGAEALQQALKQPPDIIVSDIMMPEMDGYQLCYECKKNDKLKDIPFVFYTATYTSQEDEKFALNLGANAFIRKPTEPDVLVQKLREILKKIKTGTLLHPEIAPLKPSLYLTEYSKRVVTKLEEKMVQLEAEITQRKKVEEDLQRTAEKLKKFFNGMIKTIGLITEERDPYTAGHEVQVTRLSCAIAREMSFSPDRIEGLRVAGLLHDIGKLIIPLGILSKAAKLSRIEFDLVKEHSKTGYNILKAIEFPWPVAKTVLQHHERMDGSGYPEGLSGKDILLEARILGVADVVEAMSSHRPYRPALGIGKALEEISDKSASLYDSDVVTTCLKVFKNGFSFERKNIEEQDIS